MINCDHRIRLMHIPVSLSSLHRTGSFAISKDHRLPVLVASAASFAVKETKQHRSEPHSTFTRIISPKVLNKFRSTKKNPNYTAIFFVDTSEQDNW